MRVLSGAVLAVVVSACSLDFTRPAGQDVALDVVVDVLFEGDSAAEGSPLDAALPDADAPPGCWGDVSNFDPTAPELSFTEDVLINCDAVFHTTDLDFTTWCGGAKPQAEVRQQTGGGPDVAVVPMASFKVAAGATLRVQGKRPVVLAVAGDAVIEGNIDAGAVGTQPGPGGDYPKDGPIATAGAVPGADCAIYADGTGQGMGGDRPLGGGGAGFRTNGGFGGGERGELHCYQQADSYECKPYCPDSACKSSYHAGASALFRANNSKHYAAVPVKGLAALDQSLTPLRGGCAGGMGDSFTSTLMMYGGAGGGAVQISVNQSLTLGPGAVVSAAGGSGRSRKERGGGSGGGSGGAVLLEARHVALSATSHLRAHGGSGGGRDCAGSAEDGHASDDNHATSASSSCDGGGRGGLSFWATDDASCNGSKGTIASASDCTKPIANPASTYAAFPQAGSESDDQGGGGGGGSGGVIIVRKLAGGGSCP